MSTDGQDRHEGAKQPTRSETGRPATSTRDATPPYKQLGDFELTREIGRGGMGVVYDARQISLKRRVALKVLPPGLGLTDQAVQRFEREAQAAAKLHHTNIVPVYATGQDQGCHYYAMELVQGQSLGRVLDDLRGRRSSPLMEATVTQVAGAHPGVRADPPSGDEGSTSLSDTDTGGRQWFDTVAKLLADVGDALQYAHDRGVIHRDVKPANLLLARDGRLCLGDFGLARVAQEPGMTVSGSFLGTPAYMSPEQVAAGRVKLDHRTDVYSLGAVLYEMLTLQRPFQGNSREQILTGILSKEPKPPRRVNPRVPVDLETICLKAMEKDPDRRYSTAGEMASDLRQYLQRGLIAARRAGPLRRTGKFLRRHPLAAVTSVALLVVGVLAVITWSASGRESREAALRALADARYYLAQGEYEPGLERVEAALDRAPGLPKARLLRAQLLMKLRRYDDAVAEARSILDANPEDWTGHLILALAANAPDTAFRVAAIRDKEHLAEVERLAPETADAYYLRALADDDAEDAFELLNRALALDPAHAEALAERARHHARRKDFPAALRDVDRLIVVRPRSTEGYRLAGRLYVELHDTERALEQFAEALRIDLNDPITLNERARLYGGLGRVEEAFADLDRAIEVDPGYARSYNERAELNLSLGRFEQGIAEARMAIAIKPDYDAASITLFNTLWSLGREEELAEELQRWEKIFFDQAEAIEPEDRAGLFLARAYVRFAKQQPEAALADADRAVEYTPEEWGVFTQRAFFRKQLGDARGAQEDCARAARFELTSPEELLSRGRSLALDILCAVPEAALADYSRAVEAAPQWADPYLRRGEVHEAEHRFDEALADFGHAIELAPAWGEAYHARGMLHARHERFERAVDDLDRAMELGLGETARSPNSEASLLAGRVLARIRLGRQEEGLALIDAALDERPDWWMAHIHKGIFLVQLGRVRESLAAVDTAIDSSQDGAGGSPYLSILHSMRAMLSTGEPGGCDRARAEIEEAERSAVGGIATAVMLGVVAEVHVDVFRENCPNLYDGPRSLERARSAYEMLPDNDDFRGTLGALLYSEGHLGEALEVLKRLDDENEFDDPHRLFYLAMTFWKLGRESEARDCYDRAVARLEATFPEDPGWRERQREAAALLGIASGHAPDR